MRLYRLLLKVKIVTDAMTRLVNHHMSLNVVQGQGGATASLVRLQK